jgi:hypothetical protein
VDFGVVNNYLEHEDAALVHQLREQQSRLVQNILHEPQFRSTAIDTAFGFNIPTWLPKGSGTDQASIIILSMLMAGAQDLPRQTVIRWYPLFIIWQMAL